SCRPPRPKLCARRSIGSRRQETWRRSSAPSRLSPAREGEEAFRVCPDVFHCDSRGLLPPSVIFELRNVLGGGEAAEHEVDHANLTPGLAARGGALVVLAQAPVPPHPGIRPFHHPAPGQDLEMLPLALHHDDLIFHLGAFLPV